MKKSTKFLLLLLSFGVTAGVACGCCFENPCIWDIKAHQEVEKCVIDEKGTEKECHELIKQTKAG